MCLGSIEWQGDPVYHRPDNPSTELGLDIQHGWKIFYCLTSKNRYRGFYHGGPYKVGQWYMADPKLVHSEDYDATV